MSEKDRTIYIKGLWHQGLVAAAVWSHQGFLVTGICDSEEEAFRLNNGELPIYEPGLQDLILSGIKAKFLKFETLDQKLTAPSFLAIMHDTEVNENDIVDTSRVFSDFRKLLTNINASTEVLITAQLPAGSSEMMAELIENECRFQSRVAYMPENLRLGQAIARFKYPELPVIGISNPDSQTNLLQLFDSEIEIHFCDLVEAEILKSALNGFLALVIVYANEISQICDSHNANGWRVLELLRLEKRVGTKIPILPGLPFSGGTLGRDVQNLRTMRPSASGVIEGIWTSNIERKEYFIDRISKLALELGVSNIGLLGLTYKQGTSTLRRSLAVEVGERLSAKGLKIFGFDPMSHNFDVPLPDSIINVNSLKLFTSKIELIVIMTPWDDVLTELGGLDLHALTIIDPYGVFDSKELACKSYFHFGGSMVSS